MKKTIQIIAAIGFLVPAYISYANSRYVVLSVFLTLYALYIAMIYKDNDKVVVNLAMADTWHRAYALWLAQKALLAITIGLLTIFTEIILFSNGFINMVTPLLVIVGIMFLIICRVPLEYSDVTPVQRLDNYSYVVTSAAFGQYVICKLDADLFVIIPVGRQNISSVDITKNGIEVRLTNRTSVMCER